MCSYINNCRISLLNVTKKRNLMVDQQTQKPEDKGGFNLFGGGKKPDPNNSGSIAEFVGELNNISRRLRIIEERYSGLRRKVTVIENNMLSSNKKNVTEIKANQEQLDDFHHEVNKMKENFKIMISEIKECAKRDEVKVLQRYIDMWEPIQFVTRREMYKLIRDSVESQFDDLNIRLQQEDYIKDQIKLRLEDKK